MGQPYNSSAKADAPDIGVEDDFVEKSRVVAVSSSYLFVFPEPKK
ncbi:hypothetical protein [Paenibacillus sophorae]|nr:hypothetical protein [Paenibacillus sophorae]